MTQRDASHHRPSLIVTLALVAISGLLFLAWQQSQIKASVETLMTYVSADKMSMVSRWHSEEILHEVETHLGERNPSETEDEHLDRHRRRLSAMLRVFPKQE